MFRLTADLEGLNKEIPDDNDNPEKVGDNKMDHVKSRQTSIKIRTSLNQDEDLCILPRNISDISQPVRSEGVETMESIAIHTIQTSQFQIYQAY
ncbi:hypothetical protein V8E54_000006 [Elaphomyces granulatus]